MVIIFCGVSRWVFHRILNFFCGLGVVIAQQLSNYLACFSMCTDFRRHNRFRSQPLTLDTFGFDSETRTASEYVGFKIQDTQFTYICLNGSLTVLLPKKVTSWKGKSTVCSFGKKTKPNSADVSNLLLHFHKIGGGWEWVKGNLISEFSFSLYRCLFHSIFFIMIHSKRDSFAFKSRKKSQMWS